MVITVGKRGAWTSDLQVTLEEILNLRFEVVRPEQRAIGLRAEMS